MVVVSAVKHAVFAVDFYEFFAANAEVSALGNEGDAFAVIITPYGIDKAALELAPAASLQATIHYLLNLAAPMTLLTLIFLSARRNLYYLARGWLLLLVGLSLLLAFGFELLKPFDESAHGLVECDGDFLLQDAFSLTGPAGELVLALQRLHGLPQVGADGVDHL
jgi:hypothetical protein